MRFAKTINRLDVVWSAMGSSTFRQFISVRIPVGKSRRAKTATHFICISTYSTAENFVCLANKNNRLSTMSKCNWTIENECKRANTQRRKAACRELDSMKARNGSEDMIWQKNVNCFITTVAQLQLSCDRECNFMFYVCVCGTLFRTHQHHSMVIRSLGSLRQLGVWKLLNDKRKK